MATEYLLDTVEKGIQEIYDNLIEHEPIARQLSKQVHENYRLSAINLYRYLLVRSHDLRKFHNVLTDLGLSGLRTSEGYIYKDLANVLRLIKMIRGEVWSPSEDLDIIGFRRSRKLLKDHTNALFGKPRNKRKTRIMVTIPSEAIDDEKIIQKLIKSGMEVARINMSHDDVEIWKKMIAIIRSEGEKSHKQVKIFMDISGPKIRTGAVEIMGQKKKKPHLTLCSGDQLLIGNNSVTGKNAVYDKLGKLVSPASISISSPEILQGVKIGERVCFDDGKIESQIIKINPDSVTVKVINGNGEAMKLKPEKGVNFPDSILTLESLTNKDVKDLLYAVNEADILGYSFVRSVGDIRCLKNELDKYDRLPAVVLKIENKEAFNNLPLLLLEAMKFPNIGVMIARGDLMVEIGDERIAEVQDQILWICEAAHIPVIWATQVFESLAKKGQASRAEVTDAAKSTRAECVMLNKGPFISKAVKKLSNILIRMEKHTSKKKSKMRPLSVAKIASELIPNMVEQDGQ